MLYAIPAPPDLLLMACSLCFTAASFFDMLSSNTSPLHLQYWSGIHTSFLHWLQLSLHMPSSLLIFPLKMGYVTSFVSSWLISSKHMWHACFTLCAWLQTWHLATASRCLSARSQIACSIVFCASNGDGSGSGIGTSWSCIAWPEITPTLSVPSKTCCHFSPGSQ